MKDRTFYTLFWVVLGLCLALTVAHVLYAVYAYQHCSVIWFVGKELW